jgi:cytochrome c-type biogenesis protein CcmE
MAREALALHLYGMEEDKEQIPTPSKVSDIKTAANQTLVLIEVWMPPFRHEIENRAVKKTLTIPKCLDDLAKEYQVNYSQILQDALKKHLGSFTDEK